MSGNKHFRYYRHFGTVEDQIHLDSRVLLLGERGIASLMSFPYVLADVC